MHATPTQAAQQSARAGGCRANHGVEHRAGHVGGNGSSPRVFGARERGVGRGGGAGGGAINHNCCARERRLVSQWQCFGRGSWEAGGWYTLV